MSWKECLNPITKIGDFVIILYLLMLLFVFRVILGCISHFHSFLLSCRSNPQTVSPFIRFLPEPLHKPIFTPLCHSVPSVAKTSDRQWECSISLYSAFSCLLRCQAGKCPVSPQPSLLLRVSGAIYWRLVELSTDGWRSVQLMGRAEISWLLKSLKINYMQ